MTISEPIRVMIVDDHDMVRRGLATFLSIYDDLALVGEARGGAEALRRCAELRPDVVLMDLMMPEMDGPSATAELRRRWPETQVIALTSFPEPELLQRVLQAGAVSYLLKNVSAEALHGAILAAHAGRSTLAPEAAQTLIQVATQPRTPGYDLTAREREVLALLVDGQSNGEIAHQLAVSPSTIKAHVSNILRKLDVASRTEAVALAVRHNLSS
ncbi:MAG TPA: response regulator transcription factor [Thermomicrobiaceae bacterium]|nr:response regulator transcription factor [Thermomicrobiaceae bacterium]